MGIGIELAEEIIMTDTNIPRRCKVDQFSIGEKAIYDAKLVIELMMPAHPLLTDAVVLLQEAQNKVADFIDQ